MVVAYLDDVVVAGNTEAVFRALHISQQASPDLGLELKTEKCELIPTAGQSSACDLSDFPEAMTRHGEGNFDLLGAPIGNEAFCKHYLRTKRLDKTRKRLSELIGLEDTHAAYKILSTCLGSCKMMYAMRTTRSDWAGEVCRDFDALVKETCEAL